MSQSFGRRRAGSARRRPAAAPGPGRRSGTAAQGARRGQGVVSLASSASWGRRILVWMRRRSGAATARYCATGGRPSQHMVDVDFVKRTLACPKLGGYIPLTAEGDAFTGLSDRNGVGQGNLSRPSSRRRVGAEAFWLLYIVKRKGCAGGGLAWFCWACWSLMRGLAYEPICCIRLCVLGIAGAWRATAGFWLCLGILRQSNVLRVRLLLELSWLGFGLVGIAINLRV